MLRGASCRDPEERPDLGTREIPEDERDHRNACHGTRLDTQRRVDEIPGEVEKQTGDAKPVAPPAPCQEAVGRRGACDTDGAEEEQSPRAHVREGFVSARVQPPHGLQRTARREKGDQREPANEHAEDGEACECSDAGRSMRRMR